ncbi:MAG: exodeoxyribonuclease III [Fibrobacteria bacterium]|nr:exodeoxyribonuclease III [Fibrobacteria bacterium]
MTTLISWNVNGIRAVLKKGFWEWLMATGPDILLVQEIKALPEQIPGTIVNPEIDGYHAYWCPAEKKGYSGVAAFCKNEPLSVSNFGIPVFDYEGRVQVLEYDSFILVNAYFPNSQEAGKRLSYKLDFCEAMLKFCQKARKKKKNVIVTGDYNIAHTPIDLTNPKTNQKNPGYLPEERAWMDKFVGAGYVDTFRMFNQDPGHYSWWSYRRGCREKDIGWRIDYFCVNEEFKKQVKEASILKSVLGSDHCPVSLTIRDA